MVAVAADERAQVGLVPVGEEAVVVVAVFALLPVVEGLVDDEQAEAVAGFEELGGVGVVGGADGVDAHVAQ